MIDWNRIRESYPLAFKEFSDSAITKEKGFEYFGDPSLAFNDFVSYFYPLGISIDGNMTIKCIKLLRYDSVSSAKNPKHMIVEVAFSWLNQLMKNTASDSVDYNYDSMYGAKLDAPTDQVNHPTHYNEFGVEVIDMMERIFGIEKVKAFCELNAFKYQMRLGSKGDIQIDLGKKREYLRILKELSEKPAV